MNHESEESRSESARARLKAAISERAFRVDREHLSVSPAGNPQSWFFDFRSIILESTTLDDIATLFWNEMRGMGAVQIGGLETAAIALVSAVIMKARENGVVASGFYVRKSRKKDGLQRMVEGTLTDDPIVLVDDGMNSGKSFIRQLALLDLLGKNVVAVCVMVRYRDLSYYRYFTERGIKIISLFTLDDFPQTGGASSLSKKKDAARIGMPFRAEWKFESPNPSYFHILPKSAPALDESRVYFGADNGAMWALNQADGSVAWKHQTFRGAGAKRIFASPAVCGGIVCFGAYDGNFYALDAKTGKKRWTYMEADWIGSSPSISPDLGLVFVGLEFGLWNKQGGIAALDLATGEKRWSRNIPTLVHSSPAYAKRRGLVVVGSTEGVVYAFDAKSGEPQWTYKTDGAVRAGFSIDEERGFVCFGSEDKHIYVLDTRDGARVHAIETLEPVYSTPFARDGKLYCGLLDKRIIRIDLTSGAVEWVFWTSSRVFSMPMIADDRLYAGGNDGRLYELDPETGRETGFFQATERIVNAIAYNPRTKRFFVPTYANELYCLKRDDSAEHD